MVLGGAGYRRGVEHQTLEAGLPATKAPAGQGAQPPPRLRGDPWARLTVLVVFAATAVAGVLAWQVGPAGSPVRSDGFGYYAYLPSMVLHHSTDLHLVDRFKPPGTSLLDNFGIGRYPATGHYLNKYPIGTALCLLPGFLVASAVSAITGGAVTGFSGTFETAVVLSGAVAAALGALGAYASARYVAGRRVSALAALAVFFGSNVFHYAYFSPSFSQVYSFAVVAWLLYLGLRLRHGPVDQRYYLHAGLAGALLGLAFDIRNTDLVVAVLLLPGLLVGRSASARLRGLGVAGGAALLAALPQLAYVWKVTGSPFTNPYAALRHFGEPETFTKLANPNIPHMLFNPGTGFLLLTPVLTLALLGLVPMWRQDRWMVLAMAALLALDLYLFASWHSSWRASFVLRPLANITATFVPMLAAAVAWVLARWASAPRRAWALVLALLLAAVTWCGLQTYARMFHPYDRRHDYLDVVRSMGRIWSG